MCFKKIDNISEYVSDGINNGTIKPGKYVKSTTIKARKGIVGEKISTIMLNGVHETDNTVSQDKDGNVDWVVTNITGEQYVMKDAVFNEKYERLKILAMYSNPKVNQ